MNLTYLAINLLVVIGPLLAIFLTKSGRGLFIVKIPRYLLAILPVAIIFVIWDIYAYHSGHWDFNPSYITGARLAGIAIEEVMFFFTIPFALLFLYDNFRSWINFTKLSNRMRYLHLVISPVTLLLTFIFRSGYTQLVLLSLLVLSLVMFYSRSKLYMSKEYWLFILIHFVLFFIVNLVLTSLPVITYGIDAIIGLRVITIPLEDFLYSYVLTTACLFTFNHFDHGTKN